MAKATAMTLPGLQKTLRAFPKEASKRLREAAKRIASRVASDSAAEARGVGGVAKYVAGSITAGSDRVPVVKVGGSKRLPMTNGRKRTGPQQTVGAVWGGSMFGSHGAYKQFKSFNKSGYYLWPTIKRDGDRIRHDYVEALDDALDDSQGSKTG